jgi:hypothetical protein
MDQKSVMLDAVLLQLHNNNFNDQIFDNSITTLTTLTSCSLFSSKVRQGYSPKIKQPFSGLEAALWARQKSADLSSHNGARLRARHF